MFYAETWAQVKPPISRGLILHRWILILRIDNLVDSHPSLALLKLSFPRSFI